MKQFIGKDVREIMIEDGPPVNAFDMADGRRAFQWYWGGGTYALPQQQWSTTTGYIGPGGYFSADTLTTSTGGQVISSKGCLTTYIARLNGSAWIVEDIRYPQRLVC